MTKNIAVVYDDTRKPGNDIAQITGNKSFGRTIYKRRTLKERVAEVFAGMENVSFYEAGSKEMAGLKNAHVILYFSDFGIANSKDLETIVYKARYAHENYKITHRNRIACVIFKDENEFFSATMSDLDKYSEIVSDAFTDLSDPANFRSFITGGFDARFFNTLTGDEYTVIKRSEKKDKIRAEYTFYELLPDEMKQWFVRPFDYREEDGSASYKMQRYHMTDLAIRYVHGSISIDEFREILRHLFHFLTHRKTVRVSEEEYEAEAKRLYIDKVNDRIAQLKKTPGYDRIAALIASSTAYDDIDAIVQRYVRLYQTMRTSARFDPVKTVSHGDMCFSNILYSNADSMVVLIDPKGALCEQDLYMDGYYDIAKLSHSICGHYDYLNSDLYEISLDKDMMAHLTVDADNRQYVEAFKDELNRCGLDLRIVRLYEASLFLSMLPLHMDRPKKVFGFVLNALAIMDSLEK